MKPIIWKGQQFAKIVQFDCHIVELETEYGNGYFTVIPISPASYRKHTPNKARVEIMESEDYTTFKIRCDWGEVSEMIIPNELTEVIETARQSAIDNDLYSPLEDRV